MIGKQEKGRSFRGCLKYVLEKPGAQFIGGNMLGESVNGLAAEFNTVRQQLNPSLGVAVYHAMLAVPAHERRTNAQWGAIAADYLQQMGFGRCQYVVVRHTDEEHDHVHIVANRIQIPDGRTVSDSHDYRRSEDIIRSLERSYGLEPVPSSYEQLDRAATTGEVRKFEKQQAQYEQGVRTLPPEPPIRLVLQALISRLCADQPTMPELIEGLMNRGVEIRIGFTQKQELGISYQFAGEQHSGTGLGIAYTFAGLKQHQQVSYEPERDDEAIGAILGGGDRTRADVPADLAADPRSERNRSAVAAGENHLTAAARRLDRITSDLTDGLAQAQSALDGFRAADAAGAGVESATFKLELSRPADSDDRSADDSTRSPIKSAQPATGETTSNLQQLAAELEQLRAAVERVGRRRNSAHRHGSVEPLLPVDGGVESESQHTASQSAFRLELERLHHSNQGIAAEFAGLSQQFAHHLGHFHNTRAAIAQLKEPDRPRLNPVQLAYAQTIYPTAIAAFMQQSKRKAHRRIASDVYQVDFPHYTSTYDVQEQRFTYQRKQGSGRFVVALDGDQWEIEQAQGWDDRDISYHRRFAAQQKQKSNKAQLEP